MTTKTILALALLGALASVAGNAGAAAFQLKEKSAKGLGRAFAGSISAPGDASVIADNPAAMRLLDGRVFQADASVVNYTIDFKGQGRDALGRPQSGGDGGDAGDTSPVPALYFHTPLGDSAHLGLSVTAPFGFKTEYDSNWMGRYNGIKTEIKAVDLGLSFSYDVNPYVSWGASVFVERAEAELYDAVDFGAVLAGARAPGFAPAAPMATPASRPRMMRLASCWAVFSRRWRAPTSALLTGPRSTTSSTTRISASTFQPVPFPSWQRPVRGGLSTHKPAQRSIFPPR